MAKDWARVNTPAQLGTYLAHLRQARRLTQTELADLLGVDRRYVYEIESGKATLYSDRLFKTLRLLGARLTIESDVEDATP
ncbi:MAG: transcriptional regulator, family [Pseudonocardiales bacterium]|nr:transcriptional regulator, family [Pseudonocardiales bacterium]